MYKKKHKRGTQDDVKIEHLKRGDVIGITIRMVHIAYVISGMCRS